MISKYWAVPMVLEFEAESAEEALAMATEIRQHVIKTGADASISCFEQWTFGEVSLSEEVKS